MKRYGTKFNGRTHDVIDLVTGNVVEGGFFSGFHAANAADEWNKGIR